MTMAIEPYHSEFAGLRNKRCPSDSRLGRLPKAGSLFLRLPGQPLATHHPALVDRTNGMKRRILYLVGQLGSGGLERQLYLLLQLMDRDRYRPEVVVWNFSEGDCYVEPIRTLGVPVIFFATGASPLAKLIALRRFVLQTQVEVIHSFTFYTNIAAWFASISTKSLALGSVRSNFTNDKITCGYILGRLDARWPRVQIYNNLTGARHANRSSGLFVPKRIFVVRNGLDLEQFTTVPLSCYGPVRIAAVGSLIRLKRWDRLLLAACNLVSRHLDFRLEFAGNGPLRQELEELARALGVGGRVTFWGHIDDVSRFIAASTFLVHTSDVEGCPNVVMEAMACGRAVIATDVGDVRSLVEDGTTGFVIEPNDDAGLADRIAILVKDRDLCRQMGTAARNKAVRHFGFDRVVQETFAAYRAAGWNDAMPSADQ